jgi:putative hemolysin
LQWDGGDVSDIWVELVLVAVLVVINAMLSGTEIALISLRPSQMNLLRAEGGSGAVAVDLATDPNRFLATIQIGITLAGFLASAVAAVSLAEPILEAFGLSGGVAETLVIVGVTIVLSFITLVFGELVPKRLALNHPVAWARTMGRPVQAFAIVMTPVVWLLSITTDAFVRLFGGGAVDPEEQVSLEELKDLIMATGRLPAGQDELLLGAFEVGERTIEEVMTPRPDVVTLDSTVTAEVAIASLVEAGFTRAPVTVADHGLDSAIGVVALQDLVAVSPDAPVSSAAKEVQALPESLPALVALRRMQALRQQMAFVLDEFGGIEGIITVEDLVEELVGEIYDEFDAIVATPRVEGDGTLLVPGRFPAHDLPEIGVPAPAGDYTTVAGLVLDQLGSVPEPGDTVTVGTWELVVEAMDDQAIRSVRFRPLPDVP